MAAAAHGGLTVAAPARLLALGDAAWTVEFGGAIDPQLHARVMGLERRVRAACATAEPPWNGVVDVVPTFRSLTVHYDPLACDGTALGAALRGLSAEDAAVTATGRRWTLPACFAPGMAPDLSALAEHAGMAVDAVVQCLLDAEFLVYQIGFMPGFPYMGGVPDALRVPRLATPRKTVPAGSIAVAGAMCAVYPWQSPGGWHLVGRTPVPLFDLGRDPPALLASGDTVRWRAVDEAEFGVWQARVQAGSQNVSEWCDETGAAP
jgi:KipI family sensor histidine kinase inhibitor